MKNKTALVIGLLLCSWMLKAQDIGSTLPSFRELPTPANGLLIIDFFATTCSNCVAAIPKLNKLQQQYGDRLKIVLVSEESKERVSTFFARNEFAKDNRLPLITDDTTLSGYFKHQTLPHVVWVKENQVVAITDGEFVQQSYIQDVLEGNIPAMPVKNDYPAFDYSKPLNSNLEQQANYSVLQGYREGASLKYGRDSMTAQRSIREYMINVPVTAAFLYAQMATRKLPYMKQTRMVFENVPKERFIRQQKDLPMALWERKYAISYESVLPDSLSEQARMKVIMADLNLKLGLHMRIENRSIPCWVVDSAVTPVIAFSPDSTWSKTRLSDFLFQLDIRSPDSPPVINRADGNKQVWVRKWKDLESLKEIMRLNGLRLTETDEVTEVLVIGKAN